MDTTFQQQLPGTLPGSRIPGEGALRWRGFAGWRLTAWLPVLLALGIFLWGMPLLRAVDPTAAVVDIGALSLVLLAVVALLAFLALNQWLLGLLWPVLRDYQRNHFTHNFKSLLPWQKITFYLVIYFGLLYAFVCCLGVVF